MKDITVKNFEDEVLNSTTPVVVDFWANFCGPCKALIPTLEQLAEENPGIKFVKVNVQEERELAVRYGVMSAPTLLFFRNGRVAGTQVGAVSKTNLEKKIQSSLG